MLELGFTDNGGAIHSAERILDILGQRLKYPGLSHINKYKVYPNAEFSVRAWQAYETGAKVLIEHVCPIRDFTRKAIEIVNKHSNDKVEFHLKRFVIQNYRLVLLTPEETTALNRTNRSRMDEDRMKQIEIVSLRRTQ